MDHTRFLEAYQKTAYANRERNGIGTLGEKTLHALLKNYFEPDESKQEIRMGSYYADIFTGEQIIEVQTRQFNRLRDKLEVFLEKYPVTVVYPVLGKKWLYWLDKESGEVSPGRVSPRKGSVYEVCAELYKIKQYLKHPNLRVHVLVLEAEEYKYLDGWGKNKKKGASKYDRIPTRIMDELCIESLQDYRQLLPEGLQTEFGTQEFAKAAHISRKLAQVVLNILYDTGAVERVGKQGNAWIYREQKKLES
ncbi:MAG: hypothetical protein J6J86_06710 [Lachnospiraceae bacterium]|nr:hypothetical protein [Lachnospiraceae bacterium]